MADRILKIEKRISETCEDCSWARAFCQSSKTPYFCLHPDRRKPRVVGFADDGTPIFEPIPGDCPLPLALTGVDRPKAEGMGE